MDFLHVSRKSWPNGQLVDVMTFCKIAYKFTLIRMKWTEGNGSLKSDYRGECLECRRTVAYSAMPGTLRNPPKECGTGKCDIPNKANFYVLVTFIRPNSSGYGTETTYTELYTCSAHLPTDEDMLRKSLKWDENEEWEILDVSRSFIRD